jgi:hypothetical protein
MYAPIPALARSLLLLAHYHRPYPSPLYWFSMWPMCYIAVFSTGGSVCSHLLTLVPRSRIFLPLRWWRYIPPKRRFTLDLHGATSQKTVFFIPTAVKMSNLTCLYHSCLQTIQIWTLHFDETDLLMLHNLEAKEVTTDLINFRNKMWPTLTLCSEIVWGESRYL